MKYFFLFVFLSLARPFLSTAQTSEKRTTLEGHGYLANTDLSQNAAQIVTDNGEVFVAYFLPFDFSSAKVTKYDSDLNQVGEVTVKLVDGDLEASVLKSGNLNLYTCNDIIMLMRWHKDKSRGYLYYHVCFFDQELNLVDGGWKTLSTHKFPTMAGYDSFDYDKIVYNNNPKRIATLGPWYMNKSGVLGVTMNRYVPIGKEDAVYTLTRFDGTGEQVYADKVVTFPQQDRRVPVQQAAYLSDGRFIIFSYYGGRLSYRLISATGEESEHLIDLSMTDFVLTDIIENPDLPGSLVLMGLDGAYHPAVYLYAIEGSAAYSGDTPVEISVGEFPQYYLASWKGEIKNNKLYSAAVLWSGESVEWNKSSKLSFAGLIADLSSPGEDNLRSVRDVSDLIEEKVDIFPDRKSEFREMKIAGNTMMFNIYNYYTAYSPNGSAYTASQKRGVHIDAMNDRISYDADGGLILDPVLVDGDTLIAHFFISEKEKTYDSNPTAIKVMKVFQGLATYAVGYHLDSSIKTNGIRVFGYHTDPDGNEFIYAIVPGKNAILLKLPMSR